MTATPQIAEVAAWLARAGRQIVPRFPAAMEQAYLADTVDVRLREQYICTLVGAVCGLLLLPPLWPLVPDAHQAIRDIWLMLGLPVGIAAAVMYRIARFSVPAREWFSTSAGVAVGIAFASMLAASSHRYPALLFGGLAMLTVLGSVPAHMSVPRHLLLTGGLSTVFTVAISFYGNVQPGEAVLLVALFLCCSFLSVYTVWRSETELRRAYAQGLHARLANSSLSEANAVLESLATNDALTGLANRRAYDAALAHAVAAGGGIGLIVIDIDNFKAYNDAYGHAAGDSCLMLVAQCLAGALRGRRDFLARIGGEEFAVILHDPRATTPPDAQALAERLRQSVHALALPHDHAPGGRLTISAGVAWAPPGEACDGLDLFDAADRALYAAKNGGRNRVVLARPGELAGQIRG